MEELIPIKSIEEISKGNRNKLLVFSIIITALVVVTITVININLNKYNNEDFTIK